VRVHIQKANVEIPGSPFAMTCATDDYFVGISCVYTRAGLKAGADYTYSFVAQDDQGHLAAPPPSIDAPDVSISYEVLLPLVLRSTEPPEGAPLLNRIDNPGGNYKYSVSWTAVERATAYTLQEDDNAAFSSPTVVYVGPNTSRLVSAAGVGTYYYRVKANSASGDSDWSNTESVVVTVPRPPCPQTGKWSGSGSRFTIEFSVSWNGSTCQAYAMTYSLSVSCHTPEGATWTFYVIDDHLQDAPITDDQFSTKDTHSTTSVKGTFSSSAAASGTWSYYHFNPTNNATCSGSGTWTGVPAP
jgi:hypothetical protein